MAWNEILSKCPMLTGKKVLPVTCWLVCLSNEKITFLLLQVIGPKDALCENNEAPPVTNKQFLFVCFWKTTGKELDRAEPGSVEMAPH